MLSHSFIAFRMRKLIYFLYWKLKRAKKNTLGHGNAFKTAPETHSKYLADKTDSERDFCAKC